jgi:4-hydroxybenzoate polyprenyltransferase/phosphoserine phosphatase
METLSIARPFRYVPAARMSAPSSPAAAGGPPPLCVDLDGTLLKTDLLWESFVALLRRNPLWLFVAPFWWLRGRAFLKRQLARRVTLAPAALPYHEPFLTFLRAQKRAGRKLILATASDAGLAKAVAEHVGVFDEVFASDGEHNLRGGNKLRALTQRFGERGFDYAGNSAVDLGVWPGAREAIVVNAPERLVRRAAKCAAPGPTFPRSHSVWLAAIQVLRPHQWVKNLIIFVPIITSHQLTFWPLLSACGAFVAMSLCASGVYVLNDLLDLDADRRNPAKRARALAAGDLPLSAGLVLSPVLLGLGGAVAWWLTPELAALLGLYWVVTSAYSWRLKRVPLLDVFVLAGLYTLRLLAGQIVTGIVLSAWLLMFSMFIFLSLALVKRYTELAPARGRSDPSGNGRGYLPGDLEFIAALGPICGCLSALVLCLYVTSQEVRWLYARPALLLLLCPLLLYWVSRVWLLARRGRMHEDPVVFALKDWPSYVVGAFTLAVIWLATRG